jgi:hypothetical protein
MATDPEELAAAIGRAIARAVDDWDGTAVTRWVAAVEVKGHGRDTTALWCLHGQGTQPWEVPGLADAVKAHGGRNRRVEGCPR